MEFQATFIGRTVGSIGETYAIQTVIVAPNENEARIRLYDYWEHITGLHLIPIK